MELYGTMIVFCVEFDFDHDIPLVYRITWGSFCAFFLWPVFAAASRDIWQHASHWCIPNPPNLLAVTYFSGPCFIVALSKTEVKGPAHQ